MANNPKKVKDPTEVALSAIQEALNISDSGVDTGRSPVRDDAAPIPPVTPGYGETPFDTRASSDRPIFDTIEEPRPARRAEGPAGAQRLHACDPVRRRLGCRLRSSHRQLPACIASRHRPG
jgi:hypothetical protein